MKRKKKTGGKAQAGPRGGKTARTPGGLLRLTLYMNDEEWQGVREVAFDQRRTASDVVREAIREFLKKRK